MRAHVFPCMLAYDVTWELRRRLAPLLYDDEQPAAIQSPPPSLRRPLRPKPRIRQNAGGFAARAFRSLLDKLQGVRRTALRVAPGQAKGSFLYGVTEPDPVQKEALRLAGVKL